MLVVSCCDGGKTKSTPSPTDLDWTVRLDWSLTIFGLRQLFIDLQGVMKRAQTCKKFSTLLGEIVKTLFSSANYEYQLVKVDIAHIHSLVKGTTLPIFQKIYENGSVLKTSLIEKLSTTLGTPKFLPNVSRNKKHIYMWLGLYIIEK